MDDDTLWRRLGRSAVVLTLAALFGLFWILVAGLMVWWFEGKVIASAIGLEHGAADARTINADAIDAGNEGKLVHLTGEAATADEPADPDFGVAAKALRLTREVEVYQWKETKTETKKNDKTIVTYKYTLIWSKGKPPRNFVEPVGHMNPADKPYADGQWAAAKVRVGPFTLRPEQASQIPADEPLAITPELLAKVPNDLKANIDGEGRLYLGDPEAPQVGDARIRYKLARPQTVTLVAKQTGDTFEPYAPAEGDKVDLLKPGAHAPQAMFEAAASSSRVVGWVVRVFALGMMTFGFYYVLRRQVNAASGLPPEGFVANLKTFLLGGVVAVAFLCLIVGGRWLSYQAAFGGTVLAIGAVTLIGMFFVLRTRRSGTFANLFGGAFKWSADQREQLRRIALDPDNAKLRLDLAAQLEKKGNPLGEFMRVDHEMESLPEGDRRRTPLETRWSELLDAHGRTWFAPLRQLKLVPEIMNIFFPSMWMHHGVIDEVKIDLAGILPEKAEQLFAAAPGLRVLEFHNVRVEPAMGGWKDITYNADVPAIAKVPQLQQIAVIKMSGLSMTVEDLKALAASPNLVNLRELDFGYHRVGPEGAVSIARSPTLKRLRVLELRACELGESGAVALAGAANLAQLTTLNLGANSMGPAGATAIAGSPYLKNLKTLALDENKIGPHGAKALAESPHLGQLTSLDLGGNEMGAGGAAILARSPNVANLTTLKVKDNKLGGTGIRFLATSPNLAKVEILELDSNEIDDAGAAALAACVTMTKLKELSLAYNNLGDAGLKALAKWPGLGRVTKLNLRQNKSFTEGVEALVASPHLRCLQELDLSGNSVGAAGARALASSPLVGTLKSLWLSEANLTPEGEQAIRQRYGDKAHF